MEMRVLTHEDKRRGLHPQAPAALSVGRIASTFGAEARDARDGSRVGRWDGCRARVQVGHNCSGARVNGVGAVGWRRVHAAVAPVLRRGLADGHRVQSLGGERTGRLLVALGHWDAALNVELLVRKDARTGWRQTHVGWKDASMETLVCGAEALVCHLLHRDVRGLVLEESRARLLHQMCNLWALHAEFAQKAIALNIRYFYNVHNILYRRV